MNENLFISLQSHLTDSLDLCVASYKIVKSIFIDEIKVHINFMKYKRDISKGLWRVHLWGAKYLNLSHST